MNQLNEKLRIIRTQIVAEEMKAAPDLEVLKKLRWEEKECLKMLKEII